MNPPYSPYPKQLFRRRTKAGRGTSTTYYYYVLRTSRRSPAFGSYESEGSEREKAGNGLEEEGAEGRFQ